jgi:hypothetical protein
VLYFGSATQVVLDELHAGTKYTFRVKATNLVGDSDLSNQYTFLMVEAPSQPRQLQVTDFTDTHVALKWKQPVTTGG